MSLIKCPECGNEISEKATVCPNCGFPISNVNKEQINQSTDIHLNKKKNKVAFRIGMVILALFVFGLVVGINQMIKNPDLYNTKDTVEKIVGCSKEEAAIIEEHLKECGISDYDSIIHDELLDGAHKKGEKGYRITVDGYEVIMYINKANKLYQLKYVDNYLYKKGKAVSKLEDYTFSVNEMTKWQLLCEDKVKSILKSPSTAKFPNITEWGFGKDKDTITIQGYVDSENGFGAELRSEFQFIVNKSDELIQSFIFDGEELIKQ